MNSKDADQSRHIYRVDRFIVPAPARDEFLDRVRATHGLLKTQPGFLQDAVLEQIAGNGQFNFVTIVEWDSQASMETAKAAVISMHAQTNFNPQEMFNRLGIKAELGNYHRVDVS